MSVMESMQLGDTEYRISRLGFGCWAIGGHGWGKVVDEDSIAAIGAAVENGVNFFDTADTYGFGKSERMLAQALGRHRHDVVIASKGGVRWDESGKVWTDMSPGYLKSAVENSLKRLKIDCIPLYYIHKPDNRTPLEAAVGALEDIREKGKIGAIGLANFSNDDLQKALKIAPISAIQVRYNLLEKHNGQKLINTCKREKVTLVAWGALADGLLTGKFDKKICFSDDDHRYRMKEFSSTHFPKYLKIIDGLKKNAIPLGKNLSQIALRWVLDSSKVVCSLFGAKTAVQVKENLGTSGWKLTKKQLAEIDSFIDKELNTGDPIEILQ